MPGNTRKNQATSPVTLRHRATMSGALSLSSSMRIHHRRPSWTPDVSGDLGIQDTADAYTLDFYTDASTWGVLNLRKEQKEMPGVRRGRIFTG
jgi:hypothetical protein